MEHLDFHIAEAPPSISGQVWFVPSALQKIQTSATMNSVYWDPLSIIAKSENVAVVTIDGMLLGPTGDYLQGEWEHRDWRNVPGPFYGADTDSCGLGPQIAPAHILCEDGYGSEFVFRQPHNEREGQLVLSAAWCDPFRAYACDGDNHWTLDLIRSWWTERPRIEEWIDIYLRALLESDREVKIDKVRGLRAYRQYLNDGLEIYLREYGFWLEHRRSAQSVEKLPDLYR